MDTAARRDAYAAESRRLLDLCAADLDRVVPTCTGWRTRNLLGHVAGGWSAFAMLIEDAPTEQPDFSGLAWPPDDDAELVSFAENCRERIIDALGRVDPQAAVWTWWGQRPMAFYPRRAHLETVVHRLDAEAAAGAPTPVDPAVAVDGVDEFYGEIVNRPAAPPVGTFHLHQTDGDGEFMLSVVDGTIVVTHEHGKGDAALRATGQELLEVVWGRRPLDGLELFGDRAAAETWTSLAP